MTQKIRIKGLYHCLKRLGMDCDEFFRRITEHQTPVLLRAEPTNDSDTQAIAVFIKGLLAGYVAFDDIARVPLATGSYAHTEFEFLVGHTTGRVFENHNFEVAIQVDHGWDSRGIQEAGMEWLNWQPSYFREVPPLDVEQTISADIQMLRHMLPDSETRMQEFSDWCEGLASVAAVPLWREAQQSIQQMIATIINRDSKCLDDACQSLIQALHSLGSDHMRRQFAEDWFPRFCQSEPIQHCLLSASLTTRDQLQPDLDTMPGHLGQFITNPQAFLTRVYYMRIPLRQWKQALLHLAAWHQLPDTLVINTEQINVVGTMNVAQLNQK